MKKVKHVQPPFCRFYIVRHGETEANIQRIIQGHLDSPLTSYGIELAVSRAKEFHDIEFAEVFASDLLRAKTTAEILIKEKKLAVKTTQLLRERNFGPYEGKHADQYEQELRESLSEYQKLLGDQRWSYRLTEGIESDQEVFERFMRFIRETAVAYPGKNVLVVSHGSLIRHIIRRVYIKNLDKEDVGHIENLAYFILETDGVELSISEMKGIEIKRKKRKR